MTARKKSEITREHILAIGRELVLRQGFGGMGLKELLDAAKAAPSQVGTFKLAAGKPAAMDTELGGLRGSSMQPSAGTFSAQLRDELAAELKGAGWRSALGFVEGGRSSGMFRRRPPLWPKSVLIAAKAAPGRFGRIVDAITNILMRSKAMR